MNDSAVSGGDDKADGPEMCEPAKLGVELSNVGGFPDSQSRVRARSWSPAK